MQIGLRLHDAADAPLSQRLAEVRKQGFTCVHAALSKLPGESADPSALTPGYALYLKRELARADLDMAVLGCYQNLGCPDRELFEKLREKYAAHLQFARILGAGMVGSETNFPVASGQCPKEVCRSDEALDILLHNLEKVVRDAERAGMILAIEPVYKHIVFSPERARQVLDRIASPNLKIIFDPVNLIDPKIASAGTSDDERPDTVDDAYIDDLMERAIELLGKDVAMIHLKDFTIRGGVETCMAPGLGNMHYEKVLAFAKKEKPHIQATLENTLPQNAEAAREFIERVYREL